MRGNRLSLAVVSLLTVVAFAAPISAQESGPSAAPADCQKLFEENANRSRDFELAQMEKRKAFYVGQQEEREKATAQNLTADQWHDLLERQHNESVAFEQKLLEESRAFHESLWIDYKARCGEPYAKIDEECHRKLDAVRPELEALMQRWGERHRQFQNEFETDRQALLEGNHSKEDWVAFSQKWESRARELHESMKQDLLEFLAARGLKECAEKMDGFGQGPVPAYSESRSVSYSKAYGSAPEPALGPEAQRIQEECEAKMKALMVEYQARMMSGDPSVRDEMERKSKAIAEECEAKMRAQHGGESGEGSFGSFQMSWDPEKGVILVDGKHLDMVGIPEAQLMTQITIDEQLFIDALGADGFLARFNPEQTEEGTAIQVYDSAGKRILSVHDNPRGLINLASSEEIPSFTLDLADHLTLDSNQDGIRFSDGQREGLVLIHHGSVQVGAGNVLKIEGAATFLLRGATDADEKLGEPYAKALEAKNIGAEVAVAPDAKNKDKIATDTAPIGLLEVQVTKEAKGRISANIDSPDGVGKTVVLKLDKALLTSSKLKVRVVAVAEDRTESPVEVREAEDLADVVNPHDDGEAIEYWIVEDTQGVQVLVSFPHFSERKVTVESVGSSALGPAIPGFEGMAALLGVCAAILVGLRRRL